MSTILALTQEVSTALPLADIQASDGILDWIDVKNTQAQATFRALSVLFGIIFVIWQAIKSQMALARIIVAGLAAGVFVWVVWNVTELKDRVDNEINASVVVETVDTTEHLV